MPISMKLEFGGLDKGSFEAYARRLGKSVNSAVAAGMKSGGKQALDGVRSAYAGSVKIRKKNAVNVISMKLYDYKPNELPSLRLGTRSPAVSAHAFGANITGPVLIPLLGDGERIGPKSFKLLVQGLMRAGNAEFRRVNGKIIVFAESAAAGRSGLNISRFRKAERARRGGKFRKQKGKALEVPIAVLVRNVHVKASFPFLSSVRAGLPLITAAIQTELDKVSHD